MKNFIYTLFFFVCSINSWANEDMACNIVAPIDTLKKLSGTDSTYYYPNGQIERIDHYSAQGVHLSSKYFRADGVPSEIVQPVFVGGQELLYKYVLENLNYPKQAAKKGYKGKVFVNFWIDEQGKVFNPQILLSPHESLSEEALRLVIAMPAWTPGTRDGKPHKAPFVMPISFQIK